MKYIQFHQICLDIWASLGRHSEVEVFAHNSTQLRVRKLGTSCEPVLRYYRAYNKAQWNEQPSRGFVIDRFVVEHQVERRYAQEGWDHFDTTYHSVGEQSAREIEHIISLYPGSTEFRTEMRKMHTEREITHSDFNYYGGSKYQFTYKSFKEIYDILKKYGMIESS